jgi:hypothetical protein
MMIPVMVVLLHPDPARHALCALCKPDLQCFSVIWHRKHINDIFHLTFIMRCPRRLTQVTSVAMANLFTKVRFIGDFDN